jgi:HKD family nuclease
MKESVPGGRWASGKEALAELLKGATSVRAAVAFVSDGGVETFGAFLKKQVPAIPHVEVIARGAPITDPHALRKLRDKYGVRVSVVGGGNAGRFHPKLWLIEVGDELRVLSGSGNLTAGGLEGNSEQFEAWAVDADDRVEQIERFAKLTKGAMLLDFFEETPLWQAWLEQDEKRKSSDLEMTALDVELIAIGTAEEDLKADLRKLYDDMQGQLKEENGHIYNRGGYRRVIEGRMGSKTPVAIVSSLCRDMTKGFERARRNNRLDLAAEVLVVDPTKAYHGLITEEIRSAAEARLRQAEEEGCAPSGV